MNLATIGITVLSVAVLAHHMFATGCHPAGVLLVHDVLIAVPDRDNFVNWIGHKWPREDHVRDADPVRIGFLSTRFQFGPAASSGVLLGPPRPRLPPKLHLLRRGHFH
jgi:cytochrome c oxidase subunit 1